MFSVLEIRCRITSLVMVSLVMGLDLSLQKIKQSFQAGESPALSAAWTFQGGPKRLLFRAQEA